MMAHEIKGSSLGGISGLGYFIDEDIPAVGTTVGYYVGPVLRVEEADFEHNCYYMAVNPSGSLLIDGSNPSLNPSMFIQHACFRSGQVNVEFREMKQQGREAQAVIHEKGLGVVRIRSTKKLRRGDELFADYGNDYFKKVLKGKCLCLAHQINRH